MKQRINTFILLVLFVGTVCITPTQAEVFFIANGSVDSSSLTRAQLKDIFLGVEVKWQNGQKIVLATLKGLPVHKTFLKEYIKKNPSQFKNYWRKMIFTGKGSLPQPLQSENELIAYVAGTRGAVGYISSSIRPDSVKVISISD